MMQQGWQHCQQWCLCDGAAAIVVTMMMTWRWWQKRKWRNNSNSNATMMTQWWQWQQQWLKQWGQHWLKLLFCFLMLLLSPFTATPPLPLLSPSNLCCCPKVDCCRKLCHWLWPLLQQHTRWNQGDNRCICHKQCLGLTVQGLCIIGSIITVFFDKEEGFAVCVNIAGATQIICNMHVHWQVSHHCWWCWWTSHENISFVNKLMYCKQRNKMSSTQSWSIKLCSTTVLATRKVHSLQKSAENHKKVVSKHTFANKTIDKQIRGVYHSRNNHGWHMPHSRLIVECFPS